MNQADYRTIKIERRGRILYLIMNRPATLNAVDALMHTELARVFRDANDDAESDIVVLTGAGRAFCAGADLAELSSLETGAEFRTWIHGFSDVLDRLVRCPKPSVAAVDGVAFGGGFELVLACDLRVVSTRARLGLPEVKLGLLPGGGGTQRVARQVPGAVAKHLLMTGDPLEAEDALRLGLVNAVVDPGEALDAAKTLAASLANGPAAALALAKQLVHDGLTMPLGPAIALERESVAHLFDSADAREGVQAFLEKRAPQFGKRG